VSDAAFVGLAYGVTWTVLTGYCVFVWVRRARAHRAWNDAVAEDHDHELRGGEEIPL